MNSRRFYFIITFFISVFLFITGFLALQTYDLSQSSFAFAENNTKEQNDKVVHVTETTHRNKKELINVLLLVGDMWGSNTDTIIVASYNNETGTLNLISIPRDTKIESGSMKIPKINAVYRSEDGPERILDNVSAILALKVRYYVYINMETFREIIDLLGGVDINIPVDLDYDDPAQDLHIHFRKGLQHLDGRRAELYLRFRKPNNSQYTPELLEYYDGSDLKRIEAQKNFIRQLIKQKAKLFYITKLNQIINTIYDNTETNISLGEALNLVRHAVGLKPDNLKIFSLPGTINTIGEYDYFIYSRLKTDEIIQNEFKK